MLEGHCGSSLTVCFILLINDDCHFKGDGTAHDDGMSFKDFKQKVKIKETSFKMESGTSLVVQWLRLSAPITGGLGSIPP